MPIGGVNLGTLAEWSALVRRIETLEARLNKSAAMSHTALYKRIRIGSSQTLALVGAGSTATVTVTWSTPMPADTYTVDVTVSALAGAPVSNIQTPSMNAAGCTVTFVVPSLIALGTTVIVQAVSAPN